MSARFERLFLAYALLLVLLAIEIAASSLPIPATWRPLLLAPAGVMAGVIATYFMEVDRGPTVIRLFAAAGVLWLVILLALGSLDPLTRIDYLVEKGLATSQAGAAPAIRKPP